MYIYIVVFYKWYCWWKKSCTSWYGQYASIFKVLYVCQVVQDFFHQQYVLPPQPGKLSKQLFFIYLGSSYPVSSGWSGASLKGLRELGSSHPPKFMWLYCHPGGEPGIRILGGERGGERSNSILAGKIREEKKTPPKNSWKILKNIIIFKVVFGSFKYVLLGLFLGFTPQKKSGENDIRSNFFPQQFFGSCLKRHQLNWTTHLVELVVFFFFGKSPSWGRDPKYIPKQLSV